jgi:hypothetical protein
VTQQDKFPAGVRMKSIFLAIALFLAADTTQTLTQEE